MEKQVTTPNKAMHLEAMAGGAVAPRPNFCSSTAGRRTLHFGFGRILHVDDDPSIEDNLY